MSASTRAIGTGLPLTVATFCAITASGSTRVPIRAAEILKFMLGGFRANGFGSEQERLSSWGISPCREVVQFGETGIPFDTSNRHPKKLLSRIPRGNKAEAGSGFVRRAGIDGKRMDAVGHPGAEGIIHEAMARNAVQ